MGLIKTYLSLSGSEKVFITFPVLLAGTYASFYYLGYKWGRSEEYKDLTLSEIIEMKMKEPGIQIANTVFKAFALESNINSYFKKAMKPPVRSVSTP